MFLILFFVLSLFFLSLNHFAISQKWKSKFSLLRLQHMRLSFNIHNKSDHNYITEIEYQKDVGNKFRGLLFTDIYSFIFSFFLFHWCFFSFCFFLESFFSFILSFSYVTYNFHDLLSNMKIL